MPSSSSTVELPRRLTRTQKRLADKSLDCLEADTRSTAHEEVCRVPVSSCNSAVHALALFLCG